MKACLSFFLCLNKKFRIIKNIALYIAYNVAYMAVKKLIGVAIIFIS